MRELKFPNSGSPQDNYFCFRQTLQRTVATLRVVFLNFSSYKYDERKGTSATARFKHPYSRYPLLLLLVAPTASLSLSLDSTAFGRLRFARCSIFGHLLPVKFHVSDMFVLGLKPSQVSIQRTPFRGSTGSPEPFLGLQEGCWGPSWLGICEYGLLIMRDWVVVRLSRKSRW